MWTNDDLTSPDRAVVVADLGRLAEDLRALEPSWELVRADTFLSGIVEAAQPGVRAVVAGIEPGPRRLDAVVAGLRAAAGNDARIVLCCRPYAEPVARRLLAAGADDYLIYPPLPEELEQSLRTFQEPVASRVLGPTAMAQSDAGRMLDGVSDVLAHLDEGLAGVLERLAELMRGALSAEGIEICAYGQTVRSGAPISTPWATEPLHEGYEQIGQVVLPPPPSGDETQYEAALAHGVRLLSSVLSARRREARARQDARIDSVSGMWNRRYLSEFLPQILVRASRERFRVTLLLFDIDNFKYYNDTYGHAAGDEIIQEVGRLMKRCCRSHDVVARFGGDEFAVVFWDADQPRAAGSEHPTDALAVLDRFRDALLNHRFASLGPDTRGRLTISGGLATYPWQASDVDSLLRQADAALMSAKQQGKNRILPIGAGWLGASSERIMDSGPTVGHSPPRAGASTEEV